MQQFPGATAAIIRGEGREQQRLLWPSFAERQAQWEAENPNDPAHNSDNESDIEMISSSAQGLLCASGKGMGKGCKGKGLGKGEDEGNFNSASGQGQGEVVLASDQLDAERQAPADAELNELIWVHHQDQRQHMQVWHAEQMETLRRNHLHEEQQLLHLQNRQREHVGSQRGCSVLREQILRQRNLLRSSAPVRHWVMQWFGEELDEAAASRRAATRRRRVDAKRRPTRPTSDGQHRRRSRSSDGQA